MVNKIIKKPVILIICFVICVNAKRYKHITVLKIVKQAYPDQFHEICWYINLLNTINSLWRKANKE